jgi:hypothetical protein
MEIKCFGQNTVLIKGDNVIYIELTELPKKPPKADYVLLSGFSFNEENAKKIIGKKTKIICPDFYKEEIPEDYAQNVLSEIPDFIEIIKAYKIENVIKNLEPSKNGYLIKLEEMSIYFAGPTDLTPEMNLITVDYAIIPVDGDCMDLFEALAATNVIDAKTFVPISYSEEENEGLKTCSRFIIKCPGSSEPLRKLPEPNLLNSNI